MNNVNKPVAPYIQLQYLSRIKTAVRNKDKEMLTALYSQCEQLNISVPHYEIFDDSKVKPQINPKNYSIAQGLPAIEITEDGRVCMRRAEKLEINGETKTLREWLKHYGVSRLTFRNRIQRGWSIEDAFRSTNH